jgi:hypothetical protein
MLLDEDEIQTVSTALYQYQSTIDRLKFISRNLKDAVEWQGTFEDKYHKIRRVLYEDYGIVEQLERLIVDGMMYLESNPVSELIDSLKDEFSGVPVVVENKVMDPVSFYYPLKGSIKLIGVALYGCEMSKPIAVYGCQPIPSKDYDPTYTSSQTTSDDK